MRYRSVLFTPGHKHAWMVKAVGSGADALLFDLEDAVPVDHKAAGRAATTAAIDELARGPVDVWVRLNGWRTGSMLADLDAVVRPGLTGVAMPKADAVADVHALDLVLHELEADRGLRGGSVQVMPMPESAAGMLHLYEMLRASSRCTVATGVIGSAPGGDYHRALGNRWTSEGIESLYSSSRAVMLARAAGLAQVLCGPVTEVDDLDRVRTVFARARVLGATGAMVIHPSHVPVAQDVFAATAEELEEAAALVRAMASAVASGESAVRYHGGMIDYAMVRSSYDLLSEAAADGRDVPDLPRIDLLSYDHRH